MPPKKSSNAAKPSSKKNAAATSTTTTANDGMTSAPFSPFMLLSYKMVRYSLSNGDSFPEVLLHGSGFSDVDDFEFDLFKNGGDGRALPFTQAIPPTFFDKAPPDHSTLPEAERKSLKNYSPTVQYANLARKIHSDLKYDINAKGPFFCQPQVIVLEKKCERIVDNTGFASPTGHVVTYNGRQHHQFMTTYWCKLKEVAEDTQQRSRGNPLVLPVVAPLMMMTLTTTTVVLPRLATRAVYNHHHARKEEEVVVVAASEEVEVEEVLALLRRRVSRGAARARAMRVSSRSPTSSRRGPSVPSVSPLRSFPNRVPMMIIRMESEVPRRAEPTTTASPIQQQQIRHDIEYHR
jgi:hypothetical protein